MSTSLPVFNSPPRSPALTTVVFEDGDEESRDGVLGRRRVGATCHPYRFVSRRAAARFADVLCDRHGHDGYRLETPGFVPPQPAPVFSAEELPY